MSATVLNSGQTMVFPCDLTVIHCNCGGVYAISEKYRSDKHKVGGTWHCPYCECSWGYSGNSENEKLKREIEQKQRVIDIKAREVEQQRSLRQSAERSAAAHRGQVTKIKRRVASGTCPCCSRHFVDLHAHMDNKHPEFKEQV